MTPSPARPAVLLVAFGTSMPEALPGIVNLYTASRTSFPGAEVRLAFSSEIIRRAWHHRATTRCLHEAFPGVPLELGSIHGPLAELAALQEQGCREILVFPTFLHTGEEFHDLQSLVLNLASVDTIRPSQRPFPCLQLLKPLLAVPGPDSQHEIADLAEALAADVQVARKHDAALVYMGHGSTMLPHAPGYRLLENSLCCRWPGQGIYIGLLSGSPSLAEVQYKLQKDGRRRVLLAPLMTVAGGHACRDMCGDHPDSWQRRLREQNLEVMVLHRGLGELPAFIDLQVARIMRYAGRADIKLA